MSRYTFTHVVDNEEYQVFDTVEYPKSKEVVISFEISEETRWDNVMLEFAKFLDMIGYVGVYEKVQKRIDDEWVHMTQAYNEDTSNPGLSD
jgi:hypothetical protein